MSIPISGRLPGRHRGAGSGHRSGSAAACSAAEEASAGALVAALAGFALGWGAFQAAHSLWASRHDSTPISSSVPTPAGEDAVSGNGITLTFPVNWVNVPTNVYRPATDLVVQNLFELIV